MTNISVIYTSFLSKIRDYNLLKADEEEIKAELFDYFESAKARFYKCKNSLDTYVDENNETIIEGDLTPYEIEIIVTLMIIEYLKPKILTNETLQQELSDKDFKIYSQANQLRELRLLYGMFEAEVEKMITKYTYMGMTDNVE